VLREEKDSCVLKRARVIGIEAGGKREEWNNVVIGEVRD